ncbi:tRNA (adenine57-N1/adenine58-N1)-methyltransferase [Caldicoprobacter guelmensis]|uniref:tRNA (adenine-N1)-methyltransferase n=1 Tax=Caldicoprobacter guelmensis TaxID=1170224 RepID=UPI00195B2C7E|nr:tRNA (adenine-N1)-methyltransferase [Caldicoprobacter guelmensis]MBM7581213.1 tRNA (adenine57-N1/adenine58-N1)-methyltransferase [Caldicoprobacter guelmensis]
MLSDFSTKRVIVGPDNFKKVVDIASPNKIGLPNGQIDAAELAEIKPGSSFTIKDKVYYVLDCDIYDYVMHYLKRKTQVVYPKEGAYILLRLDISPGKRVGEAGTGSGAFTVCLSRAVGPQGQVYTYEQREEFYKLAQANLRGFLQFDNVTMYNRSIEEGIQERNLDAFFLDVREPWTVIGVVREALKPAGHLGIIVPTTNQVCHTLTSLEQNNFYISEVVEIIMRKYKPIPARLRPKDLMVGHTGYLIFARKLGE